MKILLILWFITGCSTVQTSDSLRDKGLDACKNVPILDGQKEFCAYSYIQVSCSLNHWDTRICGQVEK